MKASEYLKKNPPRISIDAGWQEWLAVVLMFLALFILPIQAVNWQLPAGNTTQNIPAAAVLGVTDNAANYVVVPVLNFRFDTTFQDPGTISFTIGCVCLLVALTAIILLVKDYRKREHKYDPNN